MIARSIIRRLAAGFLRPRGKSVTMKKVTLQLSLATRRGRLWPIVTAFALLSILSVRSMAVQEPDRAWADQLVRDALTKPQAYNMLTELTQIGGRMSGSPQAEQAVEWGRQTMRRLGFENVHLVPCKVPHWVRGKVSRAEIVDGRDRLSVCALGGSVGTSRKGIEAEVVEVHSLAEAEALGANGRGKIVFYNRPMDPTHTITGRAYGGAVDQRSRGAASAAKSGAVAAIVRSMTLAHDDYPHTGHMAYTDGVPKIPAAAVSTVGADRLSERLKENPHLRVRLELDCKSLPDADSFNVVGEVKGSEHPDEIIVMGGHLDSWDLGQGAHDDGAGVVHSLEALRLLKESGFHPKRTIRVVLFMDEENGGRGADAYAAANTKHFAAMESDDGGFMPRAFSTDAKGERLEQIKSWLPLLAPTGIERFEPGGGGADVGPLAKQGTVLFGLRPDDQRYFDYHHSYLDRLDKVNPREVEMGAAAMAILARLLSEELR